MVPFQMIRPEATIMQTHWQDPGIAQRDPNQVFGIQFG